MDKESFDEVTELIGNVLDFPCPKCGSAKGDRCLRQNGEPYSPALSHKARFVAMEQYDGTKPITISAKNTATEKIDKLTAATVRKSREVFHAEQKEERIKQVLFGIDFARNIVKVPQSEIDMRLAIMIVEAELDLKLF